jgi:hypothetical protein
MTLIYTRTTTTVTNEIHAISDEELVTMLSAWHTPDRHTPIESHVTEQVRTEVVDALHDDALHALESGISPDAWVAAIGPRVEAEVSGRTVNAVLGGAA